MAVLLHLLERRFPGQLSAMDYQRIQAADAETLLSWSERLFDAASPAEVLQPSK